MKKIPPRDQFVFEAKTTRDLRVEIYGDVERGKEHVARGRALVAKVRNEVSYAPDADRDQYDSAGYFTRKLQLPDGTRLVAMINDTHEILRIYPVGGEGGGEEKSEEKPKKKEEALRYPYLWIGVRPVHGGRKVCTPYVYWSYDIDEMSTDGAWTYFDTFFQNAFASDEQMTPQAWLWEPGQNYSLYMGPAYMIEGDGSRTYDSFTSGSARHAGWSTEGQKNAIRGLTRITDSDGNQFSVTENGTWAGWFHDCKTLDPIDPAEKWYCAFWVDPHFGIPPSIAGADPAGLPAGFLVADKLPGEYALKLVATSHYGIGGGFHDAIELEIEVRSGKLPYMTVQTFYMTLTRGLQHHQMFIPNGYGGGMDGLDMGPFETFPVGFNPYRDNWAREAVLAQVPPLSEPYPVSARMEEFMPEWGFEPGAPAAWTDSDQASTDAGGAALYGAVIHASTASTSLVDFPTHNDWIIVDLAARLPAQQSPCGWNEPARIPADLTGYYTIAPIGAGYTEPQQSDIAADFIQGFLRGDFDENNVQTAAPDYYAWLQTLSTETVFVYPSVGSTPYFVAFNL